MGGALFRAHSADGCPNRGPREFPLPDAVLAQQLSIFGAITVYRHREVAFSADLLLPLLEELL